MNQDTRARNGEMVPLAQVVKVSEQVVPRELNHFGQRRAVTISANLAPGYSTDYEGQSREFRTSSSSLALVFLLALAFIYLVPAAQFESFRDPFIIMLTVRACSAICCVMPCSKMGRCLSRFAMRRLSSPAGENRASGLVQW